MIPTYDSWVIMYECKKIIGYTHTYQEAEKVCQKNHNYSWEHNSFIKSKEEKLELYNSLKQLTYNLIEYKY